MLYLPFLKKLSDKYGNFTLLIVAIAIKLKQKYKF